jgi:hypothetical protein
MIPQVPLHSEPLSLCMITSIGLRTVPRKLSKIRRSAPILEDPDPIALLQI